MKRLWKAFQHSVNGLKEAFMTERSFQQEVIIFLFLLPLILLMGVSPFLKLLLIVCSFIVVITELLNSSIEAIADVVSPEYHTLIKRAKDFGSAAVFLSLVNLFAVWMYAFYKLFPHS